MAHGHTLLVRKIFTFAGLLDLAAGPVLALQELPPDLTVAGGSAVRRLCGACCQENAFCGALEADTSFAFLTHGTLQHLTIAKGSNLTCILRERNVFGAVDGGLCVPSKVPADLDIKTLCTGLNLVIPFGSSCS